MATEREPTEVQNLFTKLAELQRKRIMRKPAKNPFSERTVHFYASYSNTVLKLSREEGGKHMLEAITSSFHSLLFKKFHTIEEARVLLKATYDEGETAADEKRRRATITGIFHEILDRVSPDMERMLRNSDIPWKKWQDILTDILWAALYWNEELEINRNFTTDFTHPVAVLEHLIVIMKQRPRWCDAYAGFLSRLEKSPSLHANMIEWMDPLARAHHANHGDYLDISYLKEIGGAFEKGRPGVYAHFIMCTDGMLRAYVGQSIDLAKRHRAHLNARFRNRNPSLHYEAVKHTSWDFWIVCTAVPEGTVVDNDTLNVLEMAIAIFFQSLQPTDQRSYQADGMRKFSWYPLNVALPLAQNGYRAVEFASVRLLESKDWMAKAYYEDRQRRYQAIRSQEQTTSVSLPRSRGWTRSEIIRRQVLGGWKPRLWHAHKSTSYVVRVHYCHFVLPPDFPLQNIYARTELLPKGERHENCVTLASDGDPACRIGIEVTAKSKTGTIASTWLFNPGSPARPGALHRANSLVDWLEKVPNRLTSKCPNRFVVLEGEKNKAALKREHFYTDSEGNQIPHPVKGTVCWDDYNTEDDAVADDFYEGYRKGREVQDTSFEMAFGVPDDA